MTRKTGKYFKLADGTWALYVFGAEAPEPGEAITIVPRKTNKRATVVEVVMKGVDATICTFKNGVWKTGGKLQRPKFLTRQRG